MGITEQFQNTFCASMSAGLLYSIVTMPFETAKNAMAFQKADPVREAIVL
jgi:solute carrier family 25 (mitochondrial oxoglutarate transporter), member 11